MAQASKGLQNSDDHDENDFTYFRDFYIAQYFTDRDACGLFQTRNYAMTMARRRGKRRKFGLPMLKFSKNIFSCLAKD